VCRSYKYETKVNRSSYAAGNRGALFDVLPKNRMGSDEKKQAAEIEKLR